MDNTISLEEYLGARRRWFNHWLNSRKHSVPEDVFRQAADFYAQYAAAAHGLAEKPKGLLIVGPIGAGKTTLAEDIVQALRRLDRDRVIILRARRMAEDFSTFPDYIFWLRQKNSSVVLLDDLGCEQIACRFGVSWSMADYLDDRYLAWREHQLPTVITTNLKGIPEITERYGERAASRIREMTVPLVYAYPDRRPAW